MFFRASSRSYGSGRPDRMEPANASTSYRYGSIRSVVHSRLKSPHVSPNRIMSSVASDSSRSLPPSPSTS